MAEEFVKPMDNAYVVNYLVEMLVRKLHVLIIVMEMEFAVMIELDVCVKIHILGKIVVRSVVLKCAVETGNALTLENVCVIKDI